MGHIFMDQWQFDKAADAFAEGGKLASAIEYELGEADSNLGLAEISFLDNQVEQALTSAQLALQIYTDKQNPLGSAAASRLLGVINMRRGQLSYANSMVERALRTYKAIAYRIGQAEATINLGELQLLRGFIERATQTYEEAIQLAQSLSNEFIENKALVGLGILHSKRGELLRAGNYLYEAQTRVETQLSDPVYSAIAAEIHVGKAKLAMLTGQLNEAASSLANANSITSKHTLASTIEPSIFLAEGQLLLTRGDFTQAESHFSKAFSIAEVLQEPLLAAEALLGLAQTRLSRKELDSASASFLEAGRQFQLLESTNGDAEAMLGVAQTLIGRGQWNEAIEHCEGAAIRFHQSGNLIGEADTTFTLGLAYRGNGDLQEAARNFEQAVVLYQQYRLPLQEADACYERAGIMLADEQFDLAMNDFARSIELVEQVMNTLTTAEQRSMFLHQYTELYAQTAITQLRRNQDDKALSTLSSFVRITGRDPMMDYLLAYENSILASADEMSENETQTNTRLVKRLRTLRKSL